MVENDPQRITFQLRNVCAVSGSGLVANLTVNRRSGRVYQDIDMTRETVSATLTEKRTRLGL
jgi:hypothetical protein